MFIDQFTDKVIEALEDGNFLLSVLRNLQIIEANVKDKNMLFALTETGLTNVKKIIGGRKVYIKP